MYMYLYYIYIYMRLFIIYMISVYISYYVKTSCTVSHSPRSFPQLFFPFSAATATEEPLKPIKEPTTVRVGLPNSMPSATSAQPL